jgi:iron complex transport system substrate-binding protein
MLRGRFTCPIYNMKKIIFLLLAGLTLASCGRFGNKLGDRPANDTMRIVCVSKQLTEMIFSLGAGNRIVGVDISSTYPEDAKKLPTVGYHRALGLDGIVSLNPTVVYDNGGIGPEAIIEQLKKVGISLKEYEGTKTIDDAKNLLLKLGAEFNNEQKAKELNEKLDRDLQKVKEEAAKFKDKPKVMIIHFGQAMNNYFVIGTRGNANEMLTMAGGLNAADTTGFKMLSPEVIVKNQPDVILATDFGFDRTGGLENFKKLPGVELTPAARNNRIFRIEEHDLVYFGPRTGENILKIMELIHKGENETK